MKKVLATILAVSMLLSMCVFASAAEEDEVAYAVEGGNIYFDPTTGAITDADEEITGAVIPSEIGGVAVTSIGWHVFVDCTSLASVTIPSSVTSIGVRTFEGCASLASITIPEGVTSIDYGAFMDCTSLASITIPSSVTSIGYAAFSDCTSLTSITIPSSVTSIGGYAFSDCTSLVEVVGGENVDLVESGAFADTPWLEAKTDEFVILGSALYKYNGTASSAVIPEGVTSISEGAFSLCNSLTSIAIPSSVTSIGDGAFSGCTSLTSITIPSSVTSIGESAFFGCESLTSIAIPSSVTSIGDWAFRDCTSLTAVEIPESVTSIGNQAFSGCTSLAAVEIPEGVTSIGNQAFRNCTSLTSVTIPESVTSIGEYAFQNCTSLASVTIPSSVTSIGMAAFRGCTALKSVVILEGVTSIDAWAFYGCTALTSVTIPPSVTSIGSSAFSDCTSLTDVYFGGSEEDWKAIDTGVAGLLDYQLADATIHYNSTMPEPSTEPTEPTFTDISPDAWYHATVTAASSAGLIAGNADGSFNPNGTLTWAQAITFAVRAAQYNSGEAVYGAADQTGANWYDVYMTYATANGIISAVPADPNAVITRGDAAVIFAAAVGGAEQVNTVSDGYFTDVANGSAAYDAVYALARAGIATGKGGGVFGVNDTFLRSEVATIVARMTGLVDKSALS